MRHKEHPVCAGLVLALAGYHGNRQPPPPPSVVTPAQREQLTAGVYNDPKLTPQQKSETINMLRSHLKIVPSGGTQ
jgi:hypothetical protein